MIRRLLLLSCCLILLAPACQNPGDGQLAFIFPLENTELAGGRSLRVTVTLVDNDGQPVEGATIQTELRAPNGDVFAILPCVDAGQGRYLADYVTLPLRGAGGTWRVIGRATWNDDQQAHAERTFKGLPSVSEEIQTKFGFWIDPLEAPHYGYRYLESRTQRYEDGSGFVFMYNASHGQINLDVHWQRADWPADAAAAEAHARDLLVSFQGTITRTPSQDLRVEQTTFQGQPAWLVRGQWSNPTGETRLGGGPIEWMIFRCPGSDWLWTIVTCAANESAPYMDSLRTVRATFECPASP
jgi:hypothetical protein